MYLVLDIRSDKRAQSKSVKTRAASLGHQLTEKEGERKRIAERTKNPRLLRISFHTFRHWKATMEYHKTKDILHVQRILGHKSINSTLLYTQLVNFEGDEYDVKVAESRNEIEELLKVGFEWVGQDKEGLIYLRKRK